MHILFFSHYFPPEGNAPASRTHEHCREWVRAGHKVTVVTCAPNCPNGVVYDGYRNKLFQRETLDGIDVRRVWTYVAPNKGTVRRIVNYVSYMVTALASALFVKKPDVIIATTPQFFCGWAGVLASGLRRKPLILEVRDLWPDSIVAVGAVSQGRLLRTLEWLERKMYAAADHIVTVGEGYRAKLVEKGVPLDKISVVMNGVDRDVFHPRDPDVDLKRSLGLEGNFIVSYVGTIGMACGLDVVLRAAKILKEEGRNDIVFLLVGDGAVRESLETQAREQGLDNIRFTGRQEKQTIPRYLSISDACLIHLRKTDLFTTVMPSKFFEAAAMGVPVIMGVEGFAAQVVAESGAGVCIQPENQEELMNVVQRLSAKSDFRAEAGEAGAKYVTTHHDRALLAGEFLKLIQTVA